MSEKDHKVSRRQFLNYSLTGVGGFMAAGITLPLVRFALDPALKVGEDTEMVAVAQVNELTNEPKRFDFKVNQVDAWYESEVSRSAWIYEEEGEIIALSPVCTHLGCTVDWDTSDDQPNRFFCPCHYGAFEKDGTNVDRTPPTQPLFLYDHEVRNGTVYLGRPRPQV
ncbi:menaquinol-cytochrome C reductase [Anaerobacillus arseniciselenatis]|uniref:Menaquinol:cytochrome c reductase iron-sulfur subunit n=1 Tax=Anaerobacillus arseniciselenatis TaxID=85682 RepID=A0A1S2LU38_9BACI|nr:ubiquinol-cytochrome c reductase iron-sulfur subunit [Anaerobacillus arseniciselenatis]OIJ15834.1 menaquinol-cytochrome C reductase [Anaerobacillus arseniciselenatis]